MRYRDFGRTGLKVSELVFGCGMVGGLVIEKDDATRQAAIDRALTSGVNWFDTAPMYGAGKSEAALGRLLAGETRPFHISTKVNVDARDLGDLRGQIERSLEDSLTRLKRDSVTLLQLHNPLGAETRERTLAADEVLKVGGVLDVLADLKRQGLCGHIGFTGLGERDAVLRVIRSGGVESAQVYFNLLNPSASATPPATWPVHDFGGVFQACADHGVAAMVIRVFSAGVIATDARKGLEQPLTAGDTVESETAKARAVLAALGDRHGTRAQAAVRFALAEPRASCVVLEIGEPEHLAEALAAEAMGPLPSEGLEAVRGVYARGLG